MPITRRSFVQLGAAALAGRARGRAQRPSQYPLPSHRPAAVRLCGRLRQSRDSHAQHGPYRPRGRHLSQRLFGNSDLHACPQRVAHRAFAVASRHARHDQYGSALPARKAAGAARRGLLHRDGREAALPPHAERPRLPSHDPGRALRLRQRARSGNCRAARPPKTAPTTKPGSIRRRRLSIRMPQVSAGTTIRRRRSLSRSACTPRDGPATPR